MGLLSGSQQFVTTPHRENKQPSVLTLTTMDNIELPVSVVPVLTDHNLKRAHRGTRRPCKTLRNQTRNLLALRCQCQPVRRTPGMLDSLAVQTTSSAKGHDNGPSTNKAAHCERTLHQLHSAGSDNMLPVCGFQDDSCIFSFLSAGPCSMSSRKKKYIIFGKKKKIPSARIKL